MSALSPPLLRCPPITSLSWLARVLLLALGLSFSVSSAQTGLVFNNGFEGATDDWLLATSPWRNAEANAVSYTTVPREGTRSVRFQAYAGHKRSEFVFRNGLSGWDARYNWGTEYWVGFSLRILQPNLGYGIICQHHAVPHTDPSTGLPDWTTVAGPNSFTIGTDANGNFAISTATDPAKVFVAPDKPAATWGTKKVFRPYALNTWYDFILRFKLATNNTGILEVWMKNVTTGVTEKLVDIQGAPTVYLYDCLNADNPNGGQPKTPYSYQKIGLYYGTDNEAVAGDMLYDAFRVWIGANGFNQVAPGGAPATPAAPSGLTAEVVPGNPTTHIQLEWQDNASNETGSNGRPTNGRPASNRIVSTR